MSDIVQKIWGFCHTLRHDGVDYGDYIEQITYLLFIKMADERAVELPKNCDWPSLADRSGTALIEYYTDLLRKLGQQLGILGDIYAKSQNRFNNPVKGYPGGDRWRCFTLAAVEQRDFKLDSFKWLKDDSLEDADDLPLPEELATDAISELEGAVGELEQVLALLENGNGAKEHR